MILDVASQEEGKTVRAPINNKVESLNISSIAENLNLTEGKDGVIETSAIGSYPVT